MTRLIATFFILFISNSKSFSQDVIAAGQMPGIITKENKVHLVYGRQDSIFYTVSDDFGKTFTPEAVVSTIPKLAASHTRGPQIALHKQGVVIAACSADGDIFSFVLNEKNKLIAKSRVNDMDTVAKENLMALSADGDNVFATWLDLRNGHNQIYGAFSPDGGRTWSANKQVYVSPDTTVCECCKPSVIVRGNDVYVMFRNWLNGYRDLYVTHSNNRGANFDSPQKVGLGGWKLAGCPMDGGGFSVDKHAVHAVFNRQGEIFSCTLGEQEKRIGSGRSCTMDASNGSKAYSWVENGNIVYLNTSGVKTIIGKGRMPVLKILNSQQAICIWENEKRIVKSIVSL